MEIVCQQEEWFMRDDGTSSFLGYQPSSHPVTRNISLPPPPPCRWCCCQCCVDCGEDKVRVLGRLVGGRNSVTMMLLFKVYSAHGASRVLDPEELCINHRSLTRRRDDDVVSWANWERKTWLESHEGGSGGGEIAANCKGPSSWWVGWKSLTGGANIVTETSLRILRGASVSLLGSPEEQQQHIAILP